MTTLVEIVHEAVGCYLAVTLAATGLAKLRSWRTASTGLIIEQIIPRGIAVQTVIAVSVAELSLAALIAVGRLSMLVGCLTAFTFLGFGGYKLAVSIRTGNTSCSCHGATRAYRATRSGVLGTVVASLIQAGLAFVWAFAPGSRAAAFEVLVVIAFVVPFAALLVNPYWRSPAARPAR